MIPATKSATNYEPVPIGSHVARVYQVIHVGTVEGFQGKLQNKVRITFELPNEEREFKQGEGPKPMSISGDYTLSFHEKSNLRQLIEACCGAMEGELEVFDVESLLGKTCLITVKQKDRQSGDGKFSFIDGATPLPKGMKCPDPVNETKVLNYTNFDRALYDSLPDFLREKIASSVEYKQLNGEIDPTAGIPFWYGSFCW